MAGPIEFRVEDLTAELMRVLDQYLPKAVTGDKPLHVERIEKALNETLTDFLEAMTGDEELSQV